MTNPKLERKFTDENEEEAVLLVKKLVDLGEELAYLHTANSSSAGFYYGNETMEFRCLQAFQTR